MESIEIVELFSRYGIDAVLLAAASAAVTVVLNYVIFNKINLSGRAERAVKLIPYILGILFYSIYSLVCNSGIDCFFENFADIIRQGLAIGTLSFVLCFLVNKIINGKTAETERNEALINLIDCYISPNEAEITAELICEAIADGDYEKIREILSEHSAEDVTDAELALVETLILHYFNITLN